MKRIIKSFLIVILVFILCVVGFVTWLSTTESGLQLLEKNISKWVTFESLSGTLIDEISFKKIELNLDNLRMTADEGSLSWSPKRLFEKLVHIDELRLNNVNIITSSNSQSQDEQNFSYAGIDLPVDVAMNVLEINGLNYYPVEGVDESVSVLKQDNAKLKPFVIDSIAASASVFNNQLELKQFDIEHAEASVKMRGSTNIGSADLAPTAIQSSWEVQHGQLEFHGTTLINGNLNELTITPELERSSSKLVEQRANEF